MLPVIAKTTPFLNLALNKIGLSELTRDDQFLVRLNQVFSDRANQTGLNNHPRGYEFDQRVPFEIRPIPKLLTDHSLQDVVAQRAAELAALDRPLKLFWSGGIDSTLMCAALLPLTNNITIYHTCESIKENPYFVDHINRFNVDCQLWSDTWLTPFQADDVVVTGTSADEITASLDESFFTAHSKQLDEPWQDFFFHQGYADLIERCEQLFAESPAEIDTLFDARWWFYFYIRHTHFARRDWDLNLHHDVSHVQGFFDCKEFDSWSMRFKHTLYGRIYSDYKRVFRAATDPYWHNQDYLQHKQKINSFVMSSWLSRRIIYNQHQYLFMYRDSQGQYCRFVPRQYPYMTTANIKEALHAI